MTRAAAIPREQREAPVPMKHDEDCYAPVTSCVHTHTADCYPADPAGGTEAAPEDDPAAPAEPAACAHVCSAESGVHHPGPWTATISMTRPAAMPRLWRDPLRLCLRALRFPGGAVSWNRPSRRGPNRLNRTRSRPNPPRSRLSREGTEPGETEPEPEAECLCARTLHGGPRQRGLPGVFGRGART